MAAARQNEMNASMAVVATRTFATGRREPGVNVGPVVLNAIRYLGRGNRLYVELALKRKYRVRRNFNVAECQNYRRLARKNARTARNTASSIAARCSCLGRRRSKIPRAGLAGTNLAQILETVDSRGVRVRELDLDRVIPHRHGFLRRHARLEHGE